MGTQGTGRKRSTKKDRTTAEDDALNLIAREAEARLAAKRAARAEAREIRMKELERQQKEIFQVQKKYYGLNTKLDDRGDNKWGDIEQWMEDSERYSRSSRIHTLSDEEERMSVGSRGSVKSDLDAYGCVYSGGGSSLHKKSKKKKKHKHKDRDRNGCDDNYSVTSGRSSRLSDESSVSRSSRLDLTSSRLSDDSYVSRSSRLDLQPASYAASDLYSLNGLSSSRNQGSAFNGYQSSLYEDSLCSGSRRLSSSTSRDNCGSIASFLRSGVCSSELHRDLDDVTIPDFSDVEDRDYVEKGSRATSALTTATLTSLGGTSSRRGSGESALTFDAESSLREIKEIHELKDQIQDVESKYTQNLKEAKDALVEVEEKYRKAMVSNAQLDNEKNNLMYQVDVLKDSLMELEELLSESQREYEDKAKEYEREKHAHGVLQFQFNEVKETLKQSEELLNEIRQLRLKQDGFVREISDLEETVQWKDKKIGALERQKEYTDAIRIERDELREEVVSLKDILKKHGIVLGPGLSINGDVGQKEPDWTAGADPSSLVQESHIGSGEGNSVLGNTEENDLRSVREEEMDLDHHQGILKETKETQTSNEELLNDQKMSFPIGLYSPGECDFGKNRHIELTEPEDIVFIAEIQKSASNKDSKNELFEEKDIKTTKTNVETNINVSETTHKPFETQDKDKVEERKLMNTDFSNQEIMTHPVIDEQFSHEPFKIKSNTTDLQDLKTTEEAKNDETEEMPSTSVNEKKKKKKKRGKKKGPEVTKTQKDERIKAHGKLKHSIETKATKLDSTEEASVNVPAYETFEEANLSPCKVDDKQAVKLDVQVVLPEQCTTVFADQEPSTHIVRDPVSNGHDKDQILGTTIVDLIDPERLALIATKNSMEILGEPQFDSDVILVNNVQLLENTPIGQMETTETCSHIETPKESQMPSEHEKHEQCVKPEEMKAVLSLYPVVDTCTTDINVNHAGSHEVLNKEETVIGNNASKDGINNSLIKAESVTGDKRENNFEFINALPEPQSNKFKHYNESGTSVSHNSKYFAPSCGEQLTHVSEGQGQSGMVLLQNLADGINSLPDSCAAIVHPDTSVEICNTSPEKKSKEKKDLRMQKAEYIQEHFAIEVVSTCKVEDSELRPDETEVALSKNSAISTNMNAPNNTSHEHAESFAEAPVKSTDVTVVPQCEEPSQLLKETVSNFLTVDQGDLKAAMEVDKSNVTSGFTGESIEINSSLEHETAIRIVQRVDERKLSEISANEVQEAITDERQAEECSQPTEIDSDNEEGQSFDFDDVEAVLISDFSENKNEEELEEGDGVMSDKNKTSSGDNNVVNTEVSMLPQENQVSSAHKVATSNTKDEYVPEKAEIWLAEKPSNILDEENNLSLGAFGPVLHNIKERMSTVVEEAFDVVKIDWQDCDSECSKSQEQLGSSKEPSQSRKERKHSNKSKGKAKGKEDCKMS